MEEEIKELEATLKKIDSKVKRSAGYKLVNLIKKTLPTSAFIIFGLMLFILIIVAVGAMIDSLKFIKIGEELDDESYEETSEFISPQKIRSYQEIENNSYIEYMHEDEIVTIYIDGKKSSNHKNPVEVKLDMTKEHRLHWQLLAAIDILSGYGEEKDDKTVKNLSKNISPQYEYIKLYKTKTINEVIEIEETITNENGEEVIKIIQQQMTTVIESPQIFIKKVSSALFDIEYEYEEIKAVDENGDEIDCYTISNVKKSINNRLENLIKNGKFKGRLTANNILEIYDIGVELPESSDFTSYMLEYMALNNNFDSVMRCYKGEGNYIVTEDNKTYRVPIKFEKENSTTNKIYISSFFGERYLTIAGVTQKNFHRGIDFAVPSGTPIVASADGEIIRSDYSNSYGNVIEIKHNETYSTVYAHNARLIAKVGDKVKKGDIISLSGNTGVSTGPHLHFEIKQNDNPINPFEKLNIEN